MVFTNIFIYPGMVDAISGGSDMACEWNVGGGGGGLGMGWWAAMAVSLAAGTAPLILMTACWKHFVRMVKWANTWMCDMERRDASGEVAD